jgi:putative transposase
MKLGIRMHLARLSLSNTISVLDELGVRRSRKAAHDWVHKAALQPTSDKTSNLIAVDETVIHINDQQYGLYAVLRSFHDLMGYTRASSRGCC